MTPCLTKDNIESCGENNTKDKGNDCEGNFTKSFEKEVIFCFVCK